jgi:hypothetical protein
MEGTVRTVLYFSILGICSVLTTAIIIILRFKKKFPEKSWVIATIDTIMLPMRVFHIGPFQRGEWTYEKAMAAAEEATGLHDWGDRTFIEAYKSLQAGKIHNRLRMTNLGQFVVQNEFEMIMGRRLRAVEYLKRHPEIVNIKIKDPVFVFGLGRSGTTFTHHLLSMDPESRSPLLWELMYPVPELKEDDKNVGKEKFKILHTIDRDVRAKRLRDRLKVRNVLGQDGMEQMHEVGADLPEECLHAMCDEFPTGANHVFTLLNDWELYMKRSVDAGDAVRGYKWYKKLLQILMYQTGESEQSRRWVLKSPLHILFLPQLFEVFPDAKLVWAHRHPCPTVTSMCTLIKALHGMYFDRDTLFVNDHGKNIHNLTKYLLPKVEKELKELNIPIAHVLYQNLIADPVGTVRHVYKEFGWEVTPEYEVVLQQFLKDNADRRAKIAERKGLSKTKLNIYHPSEFGLTVDELNEGVFDEYAKRFNITSPK